MGRSLSEWTATSTRPRSSASRSAVTNTPVPPRVASGARGAVALGGDLDELDLAAEALADQVGDEPGLGRGEQRGAGADADDGHESLGPRPGDGLDRVGVEGEQLGQRGGVGDGTGLVGELLDRDGGLVEQLVGDPA